MKPAPRLTQKDIVFVNRRRLAAVLPEIADIRHPIIDLLAATVTLSRLHVQIVEVPMSVEARVIVTPPISDDPAAGSLLAMAEAMMTEHAGSTRSRLILPLADRIDDEGFVPLVIELLKQDASIDSIVDMAKLVSQAMKSVIATARTLAVAHLKAVLARDLPELPAELPSHSTVSAWLIAPERSGSEDRSQTIARRFQAFSAFPSLVDVLRQPGVTTIIDAGQPLKPALMSRLGLTEAELRSVRGVAFMPDMIPSYHTDFAAIIRELKAHSVPLNEWPGKGRPQQREAWAATPWFANRICHMLRPDYLDLPGSAVSDALKAAREDLLSPIVDERAEQLFGRSPPGRVMSFLHELAFPTSLLGCEERRHFLAVLRQTVVGPRGAKSFHEAVTIWHRRAATVSAMRHEQQTDRPGWPAICAPWQSPDGIHSIVPLTSAADLVEEGNALDHCVGGYYDPCRRGDTQILSIRQEGAHAATVELKLSGDDRSLSTQIGQFKSFRNARPSDTLHDVLKSFIGAINRGEHAIDRKTLLAHRKLMRDTWDGYAPSGAVPLDHARKVFPLYRPLLPRGIPDDFDEWRALIAIDPVIDRALGRLAKPD